MRAIEQRPTLLCGYGLLAGVGALTAAAAALRFSTLDAQSFGGDEAVTVLCFLEPGLGDALDALPESERTPPLYYVLAWGWAQLFGAGEIGARSLPALLGTAVVPVAYAAGAALISRRAGLVAAALVAVHPLLVWYSQEARAYSLLVLLGALSLLFFARALAEPRRRNLLAWALVSCLALLTHYFAIFLIAPQALWLAFRVGRSVAPALAAVVLTGLALLPLALVQESAAHGTFIADTPLDIRVRDLVDKFLAGESGAPWVGLKLAAGALVLAGLVLLVRVVRGRERDGGLLAVALGAVAVLTPLVLAPLGADYFYDRNVIAAIVPLALGVSAGLAAARAGLAGVVAAVALCALLLSITLAGALDEERHRHDWREVARSLGEPRDGRVVLTTSGIGFRALKVYRPELSAMPPEGVRTDTLVAIGPEQPSAARLDPPSPGFGREGSRHLKRLSLTRFAAPEPRLVEPLRNLPEPFESSSANNLVERPPLAEADGVEEGFCRSGWAEVGRL